jgi:pimeloyl-ACP methyl ester carboxylesterase
LTPWRIRQILPAVLILTAPAGADDMPPAGQFIEIDDARIRYVDEGTGPAVLLLHGASSNSEDMRLALGEHLNGFRAVYVDRPGLGWSERPDMEWTPEREAALLAQLIERLGMENPVVVGHSWGGAITMRLAIDHGHQLRGAVLIGAPLHSGVGEAAWYNRVSRWFGIGPFITRVIIPLVGPQRIDEGLEETFSPEPVPEGYADAVQVNRVFRAHIFKANAEDMAQVNAHLANQETEYAGVTLPVVLLAGGADRVVFTHRHSTPVSATMENAELIVREDWGHMLHHGSPESVVDAVRRLHSNGDN